MYRLGILLMVGLACWPMSGCARRMARCEGASCPAPVPCLNELLPAGERGQIRLAVDAENVHEDDAGDLEQYHPLTEQECQCLAAEQSSLANLLDDHRRKLACESDDCSKCDQLLLDVLHFAALEVRNRTAGGALELYYAIVRLEAQREILDESLAVLEDAAAEIARAREQGLSVPLSAEGAIQQRIEARRKRVELEAGLTRANRELTKLLGAEWCDDRLRVWPETELRVVTQSFVVEEEIALAMQERPELQATGRLASSACLEHLPTLKAILAGHSAFLAASPLPGSFLLGRVVQRLVDDPAEHAERMRQLREIDAQQRRQVRDDVRLAVRMIADRHDQAVLAREALQHWERRIVELERARDVNKSQFNDLVEAQLKRLEARSTLVESIVAWQLARVKLKEAQGELGGSDK